MKFCCKNHVYRKFHFGTKRKYFAISCLQTAVNSLYLVFARDQDKKNDIENVQDRERKIPHQCP